MGSLDPDKCTPHKIVGLAMLLCVTRAVVELWVLLSFAVVGLVALFRQFGSSGGTTVASSAMAQSTHQAVPARAKGQVWNPVAADR